MPSQRQPSGLQADLHHGHHLVVHCTDWRPRNFSGDQYLPAVVKARLLLGYGVREFECLCTCCAVLGIEQSLR